MSLEDLKRRIDSLFEKIGEDKFLISFSRISKETYLENIE